jgi:hypothetical protein
MTAKLQQDRTLVAALLLSAWLVIRGSLALLILSVPIAATGFVGANWLRAQQMNVSGFTADDLVHRAAAQSCNGEVRSDGR